MHRQGEWRKSSYSGQNGACVALNGSLDGLRDTKNGATLHLSRPAVTALLQAVNREHFRSR